MVMQMMKTMMMMTCEYCLATPQQPLGASVTVCWGTHLAGLGLSLYHLQQPGPCLRQHAAMVAWLTVHGCSKGLTCRPSWQPQLAFARWKSSASRHQERFLAWRYTPVPGSQHCIVHDQRSVCCMFTRSNGKVVVWVVVGGRVPEAAEGFNSVCGSD